ncbi:mechanosensitive ion channel family protein [Verrucomicrobiaceae bacterium N1E253]|uniref:Mechanosensing system component YbdG n=1 Tax=Oceaniferula marina TaxID=2748318 RepID=A0A851GN22_9BACT|nr:mechanosensitive ion channel family protein [Oceaniferula marina]NWK57231.1 mechanosensitive ion channel family protein [Oceaniferula marina]
MQEWHNELSKQFFNLNHADLGLIKGLLVDAILFSLVLALAALAYYLVRNILVRVVNKVVHKTKNTWDDELLQSKLLTWVALLVPTVIIWNAAPLAITTEHAGYPFFADLVQVAARVTVIILSFLAANSLLNIVERIYERYEVSRELPIKSLIQVIRIILVLASLIFIISTLLNKSPVLIFSGLGAMTAIMMLIFKDSILGLVAGVQLSANRMVARGDWIEMPKFGADGDVLEVALTTVKVRNWDMTITTIPTYALISDSFKNWRGMSNSGVRRIKRAINIDMSTVGFLNDSMLSKMQQINLLKPYLAKKQKEIDEWNTSQPEEGKNNPVNARALTNLGTFRAYCEQYLKNHPKIDDQHTLLVRQLQPTDHGIPIELYIFTNDNRWVHYEGIQSDIFDHLLSVLPEFGLRAFQSPSDHCFKTALQGR